MSALMSEKDACGLFVDLTLKTVYRWWQDGMANDLGKITEIGINLRDNKNAAFEFASAFLALQMDTLFHIFEKKKAERWRNLTLQCIESTINDYGHVLHGIEKYENIISKYPEFNYPAKHFVPPLRNLSEAIGIALADSFGGKITNEIGGKAVYNIFKITLFGDSVILFSTSWNWRKFVESIEILEESKSH